MRFTVFLTARAVRDLVDAKEYIARNAPETAENWYIDFLETLLQLEVDPYIWPLAPETFEFPFELRQFLFISKSRKANRALFTIVEGEVRILAIRRPGLPFVVKDDLK